MNGNKRDLLRDEDAERRQIRGFTRIIVEIQWLLLLLCAFYLVATDGLSGLRSPAVGTLLAFALFVGLSQYAGGWLAPARWRLVLETGVMIGFITAILWLTGKSGSPLVNAYLLVIIISSLALGKTATLVQTGAISLIYVGLGFAEVGVAAFAPSSLIAYAGRLMPFWLVGYLCTMLADDMFFARRRLNELAQTDELTGLLNMRMFRGFAEREFAKARRTSAPFSIVMVDVDDLKVANDRHGHEAGNRLIRLVADTLAAKVRESDVVGRYGGDEFVLLLPRTRAPGAMNLAERVVEALQPMRLTVGKERVGVTVSVGIASYPQDGDSIQALLETADQAMYASKQRGKNQVSTKREPLVNPVPHASVGGAAGGK